MSDLSKEQIADMQECLHAFEDHYDEADIKTLCDMAENWRKSQEAGMVSVPEGWKIVPIEPTQKMLVASWNASQVGRSPDEDRDCWKAMLSAAPAPADQVAHGDALEPRK